MLKTITYVGVLWTLLIGLVACSQPEPSALVVDKEQFEASVALDDFELSDITLKLMDEDGGYETFSLSASMLSQTDLDKLSTAGTHHITITYEGFSTTLTLTLLDEDDQAAKAQFMTTNSHQSVVQLETDTLFNGVIFNQAADQYQVLVPYDMVKDRQSLSLTTYNHHDYEATKVGFDIFLNVAVLTFHTSETYQVAPLALDTVVDHEQRLFGVLFDEAVHVMPLTVDEPLTYLSGDHYEWYYGELFTTLHAESTTLKNGSAMFNTAGAFLGFVSQITNHDQLTVVPSYLMKHVLSTIAEGEAYMRFGIWYDFMRDVRVVRDNPHVYPEANVPSSIPNGVYVSNPSAQGLLGLAGVQDGDVIISIGTVSVYDWYDVHAHLHYRYNTDDDILITVMRDEQTTSLVFDHTTYTNDYFTYQRLDFETAQYIGMTYGDYLHGHGVLNYDEGDHYTGQFNMGAFAGYGEYQFADGRRYEGMFKDNTYHGEGTLYYPDGTYYEGIWLDHNNTESGVFVDEDGEHISGIFEDGTFIED